MYFFACGVDFFCVDAWDGFYHEWVGGDDVAYVSGGIASSNAAWIVCISGSPAAVRYFIHYVKQCDGWFKCGDAASVFCEMDEECSEA